MPSKGREQRKKRIGSRFVQRTSPNVGPELKFSDSVTLLLGTLNDTTTLLNTIATGTDYNQMVGRRARIVKVMVEGYFSAKQAMLAPNVVQPCHCRLTVVYDRQTDGLPITYTDVFQSTSSSSPQDMNTRNRFVILHDHHAILSAPIALLPAAPAASVSCPVDGSRVSFKHDCALDLVKRGVTAAVADIESGSIWVLLHSDAAIAGAIQSLDFTGYSRVYYTDS
jgi:hypothetical protein